MPSLNTLWMLWHCFRDETNIICRIISFQILILFGHSIVTDVLKGKVKIYASTSPASKAVALNHVWGTAACIQKKNQRVYYWSHSCSTWNSGFLCSSALHLQYREVGSKDRVGKFKTVFSILRLLTCTKIRDIQNENNPRRFHYIPAACISTHNLTSILNKKI